MQIQKLSLMSIASAVLAAYLAGAPARADDVKAGDLVISQAWSRATPKGAKTGGGYLTIENKGSAPDRRIGRNRRQRPGPRNVDGVPCSFTNFRRLDPVAPGAVRYCELPLRLFAREARLLSSTISRALLARGQVIIPEPAVY
jgi:hypothetical protein